MKTTSLARPNVVRLLSVAVALTATLLAGCKEEDRETQSVLYLQPDGAATWTILEWDIQPGIKGPEDRRPAAERDFLAAAHNDAYPIKATFERAGATRASTTLLKDSSPFEIYTLGEFRGVDQMFRDLYMAAGFLCTSTIEHDGAVTRWTLRVLDEGGNSLPDVESLEDAFDKLKVVLTKGRFVEARGFKILDDRTAEVAPGDKRDGEPEMLVLAWTEEVDESRQSGTNVSR